jgi:hypothetical protein
LFTPVSFPHRDDARSFIVWRVRYDYEPPSQQAQRDEPLFSISEAIVFEGHARPRKNGVGILEFEAMLDEVLPVFRFIPFVLHFRFILNVTRFVVTCKVRGRCLSLMSNAVPGCEKEPTFCLSQIAK